jgi:hypothetical protein
MQLGLFLNHYQILLHVTQWIFLIQNQSGLLTGSPGYLAYKKTASYLKEKKSGYVLQ